MRRFLLHVLPGGFHRIPHFGLLANANRREGLQKARELLGVPVSVVDAASQGEEEMDALKPTFVCRHCGAAMLIIETLLRDQSIRGPP